jgi:hypothetical protein
VKSFLFLFPVLLVSLASCATAPSAEEIGQKVASLLGEPRDPGIPQPEVVAEPTGLRWTLFRNQDKILNGSGAQSSVFLQDSPLGISFGNGLFLDSQGNLSLLPLALWFDHWSSDVKYDAVVSQVLWSSDQLTNLGVKKTSQGFLVYHSGIIGNEPETIDLQNRDFSALSRKIERLKDNSWRESSLVQITQPAHLYDSDDSGIRHTVKSFTENSTLYTFGDQGVKASDGNFVLVVDKDHWTIRLNGKEWRLYLGSGKALLIDARTGETALMTQTSDGAVLTSSRGNKESIVTKN